MRIRRPHKPQAEPRSQYTVLVDIPKNVNAGLHSISGAQVEAILGAPPTKMEPIDAGPFHVHGNPVAVNSLKEVLMVINSRYPLLYDKLDQNGMFVLRNIAGTRSKSLHSWGIAIDLMIDDIEDVKWNDKAFYGLALIAPIFNEHGWFWGGAFRDKETKKGSGIYQSNEDAMHFEVSREKLLEWQRAGMFGPISKTRQAAIQPAGSKPVTISSSPDPFNLRRGDNGPRVVWLQNALRSRRYNIPPNGRFGPTTEWALIDFQRKHGLPPNGIVGPKTALYLALF